VVSLGPWPRDLELVIFVSNAGWCCGLSPATQASDVEYREGAIPQSNSGNYSVKLRRMCIGWRRISSKLPATCMMDFTISYRSTRRLSVTESVALPADPRRAS
jgi:hypothetical protein